MSFFKKLFNFSSEGNVTVEERNFRPKEQYPKLRKIYKKKLKAEHIIGKFPPNFECTACKGIIQNPSKLSCGHVFCEKCANKKLAETNKCPACNAAAPTKKLDTSMKSKIDNTKMNCRYYTESSDDSCSEVFLIKDLEKHEESCHSCWVKCEGSELADAEVGNCASLKMRCHSVFPASNKDCHFEDCLFVAKKCSNRGCSLFLTRKNWLDHVQKYCTKL